MNVLGSLPERGHLAFSIPERKKNDHVPYLKEFGICLFEDALFYIKCSCRPYEDGNAASHEIRCRYLLQWMSQAKECYAVKCYL
jgi:hypothetical protein